VNLDVVDGFIACFKDTCGAAYGNACRELAGPALLELYELQRSLVDWSQEVI